MLTDGSVLNALERTSPLKPFKTHDLEDIEEIIRQNWANTHTLIDPTQTLVLLANFAKMFFDIVRKNQGIEYVMYFSGENLFAWDGHKTTPLIHTGYEYLCDKLKCRETQWAVIYDAARSRGTDFKFPKNARSYDCQSIS